MKKILITIFQLSVTIGVLYWVYHDPNRRAQMVEALRNAEYRWVLVGDAGLCGCGNGGRVSLARFAEGAKHSPECPASCRAVFYRIILQPISSRRHWRRHHQKLLPAEGNAGQEKRARCWR